MNGITTKAVAKLQAYT